jgi:hypothetical protein
MNDQEFETLCDELEKLIELGPGVNDTALRGARALVHKIRNDGTLTGYVKEKATEAEGDFTIWFSATKWRKYDEGDRLRRMLLADISKLRGGVRRPRRSDD